MGAALTYARRYALFTWWASRARMISTRPNSMQRSMSLPISSCQSQDGVAAQTRQGADGRPQPWRLILLAILREEKPLGPLATILGQEQSAALRERMLADLGQLRSPDEAADWAHKNLSLKNMLSTADADLVEARFRESLATIETESTAREAKHSRRRQRALQLPITATSPFPPPAETPSAAPLVVLETAASLPPSYRGEDNPPA